MKNFNNKFYICIVLLFSFILGSCGGSSEEYCEDEELVRIGIIDTVYKEVKDIEDSTLYVQIGAFVNKDKADEYATISREKLGSPVQVKLFADGVYRLFVGEYTDIQEAKKILEIVKSRGYLDAFIRDAYGPIKNK
ncbi:MAG: SPOR domain-containing protein [Ignavibacteria bacterium]|nr:SPOR domain-containing protein [Ignavibacteria bacterium]